MIPAIRRSSVDLPEPLRPIEPDGLARLDRERHVVERLDVGRLGAAAEDEQLLQAARLVRVDAEAARDPVDADLAGLHPMDGTAARSDAGRARRARG